MNLLGSGSRFYQNERGDLFVSTVGRKWFDEWEGLNEQIVSVHIRPSGSKQFENLGSAVFTYSAERLRINDANLDSMLRDSFGMPKEEAKGYAFFRIVVDEALARRKPKQSIVLEAANEKLAEYYSRFGFSFSGILSISGMLRPDLANKIRLREEWESGRPGRIGRLRRITKSAALAALGKARAAARRAAFRAAFRLRKRPRVR